MIVCEGNIRGHGKVKNIASVRIGLLGGRSYGKTVFLTKLISLADSSTDGFLQFDAGSETLQIKNAMLENDGRVPATSIKEISKYNFILGKQSGERWRIQFCDYAGELLERIDAKQLQSNNADSCDFTADSINAAYIRKIKKWLRRCDAYIVLMPEDITNTELYPVSEVNIFKQNIGSILKLMQDDPVLQNRPVCLAINKWDLADNRVAFEDFIKREPFASFKQQLTNMCGNSLFCLPISAFGKHDAADSAKADPTGKPFQVSKMLVSLASKAEYTRVTSICKAVKKLSRWFGWPKIPWLLAKNDFRGVTNERLKHLNSLYWKKYRFKIAIKAVVTIVIASVLISGGCIYQLRVELQNIQRQMNNGFVSPEQIANIERELFQKKRIFNFVFRCEWGDLHTIEYLCKQFSDLKAEYNENIFTDLEAFVKERKSKISNPDLAPDIREQMLSEVNEAIDNAQKRITPDSPYFFEVDRIKRNVKSIGSEIEVNKPFDIAYQEWLNIADGYEKAKKAIIFLAEFTEAKFPEREQRIKNVRDTRKMIEDRKYNDLYGTLHREIYADDFGKKTDSYPKRMERAKARMDEIDAEIRRHPQSSRIADYQKLKKDEEDRIAYLNTYGPFDVDVEKLLADNKPEAIKSICDFINQSKRTFEKNRTEAFQKLEAHVASLNKQLHEELLNKLNSPENSPDPATSYQEQIVRADKRITIITQYKPIFSEKLYLDECDRQIRLAEEIKKERALYGPFDVAYQKIFTIPEDERIHAIDEFIKAHPEKEFPARAQIFSTLKQEKWALEDNFYKKLLEKLPPRQPCAKWREQITIAGTRINILKEEQKKFSPVSEQWKNCSELIADENKYIRILEYNGKFDDAYDELQKKPHDWSYIREVHAFCSKYDKKTYPDRADLITELQSEMQKKERALFAELRQIDLDKAASWKEKYDLLNAHIARIRNEIKYFTETSQYIAELNKLCDQFLTQAENIKHYGKFDDEWTLCQSSLSGMKTAEKIATLDKFLQEHSENAYAERNGVFSGIKGMLENCNQEIRKNAIDKLEAPNYADNDDLLWDVKIHRANLRIKIAQEALNSFSKSAPYKDEFAEKIKLDRNLIERITDYKSYYIEYTETENLDKYHKILAIDKFITKFQGQFPEPIPRYSIERLKKQKDELKRFFDSVHKKALEDVADGESLPWQERQRRAHVRKDELEIYQNATGADKSAEIEQEDRVLQLCAENIAFEKEYSTVIHGNDNTRVLFTAINDFRLKFPQARWGKERSQEYGKILQIEQETVKKIEETFATQRKNPQEAADLDAEERILEYNISLHKSHLEKYPRKMPQYGIVEATLQKTEQELDKTRLAKTNRARIQALLAEGRNLAPDKLEAIGVFLTGITSLLKEFPEGTVHRFVVNDYQKLIRLRDEWNSKLYDQMKKELKPYEDVIDELPDDEKGAIFTKILSIREKYLNLFSSESNQFNLARREYDNSQRSKEKLSKETKIEKELNELKETLLDDAVTIAEKIKRINMFEEQLAALGTKEQFPRFRTEFEYISEMKNILEWDRACDDLCRKVDALLENTPSGDDEGRIREFKKKCLEYNEHLTAYIKKERTAAKARKAQDLLTEKINYCTEIEDEWEASHNVHEAGKKFMENPSDDTFQAFEDASSKWQNHSQQNHLHKRELDALIDTCKKINETRLNLDRSFQEFRYYEDSGRLEKLCKTAIEYMNLVGKKNDITEYVCQLGYAVRDQQFHPFNFSIVLQTFNFSDSGFASSWGADVDFFAQIAGIGATVVFKIPNIAGKKKNNPSPDDIVKRLGSTGVRCEQCSAQIDGSVNVYFGNESFRDDMGSASPVEVACILARGMDTGECDIVFTAHSTRRPNKGSGSVTIRFTGLPRLRK